MSGPVFGYVVNSYVFEKMLEEELRFWLPEGPAKLVAREVVYKLPSTFCIFVTVASADNEEQALKIHSTVLDQTKSWIEKHNAKAAMLKLLEEVV